MARACVGEVQAGQNVLPVDPGQERGGGIHGGLLLPLQVLLAGYSNTLLDTVGINTVGIGTVPTYRYFYTVGSVRDVQ